ncbi:Threonine synthase [compost metagenome]
MEQLHHTYHYVACPHTAIAWLGSQAYRGEHPGSYGSVFLSTAHPCKFPDAISEQVFSKIKLPVGVEQLHNKPKVVEAFSADYAVFKNYLITHK